MKADKKEEDNLVNNEEGKDQEKGRGGGNTEFGLRNLGGRMLKMMKKRI